MRMVIDKICKMTVKGVKSKSESFFSISHGILELWRKNLRGVIHRPPAWIGLRHFLQVKPVCYILSCCHGNKITKGTLQNFALRESEKSVICKDIELKFGKETKFGPLTSKTSINLQFDVIMKSSWCF